MKHAEPPASAAALLDKALTQVVGVKDAGERGEFLVILGVEARPRHRDQVWKDKIRPQLFQAFSGASPFAAGEATRSCPAKAACHGTVRWPRISSFTPRRMSRTPNSVNGEKLYALITVTGAIRPDGRAGVN